MRSILDTLSVIKNAVTEFEKKFKKETFVALIGGHAVIFYGVERTTLDVDACFYTYEDDAGKTFYEFLKVHYPKRFQIRFLAASKDPEDPLKHDIIIIDDLKKEYPRTDILIARYKWELEGLKEAKVLKGLSFPVMPQPYLVAMKLRAGGRKDDLDVIEMLKSMPKKQREECMKLAKVSGRDRKLTALLKEVK